MNEIVKTDDKPIVVQSAGSGSLLSVIAQAAADPTFDLERLERLFAMQRQVLADEAKVAYQLAMAEAQSEMPRIVRDAKNLHTGSRYARLEAIDAAIRPIYTRHGFSLSFDFDSAQDSVITVLCTVSHAGGHTQPFKLPGALDAAGAQGKANKTAIQAMGSTVSYLRRYLTCMIFNIALSDDDNDGNARANAEPITAEQKSQLIGLLSQIPDETESFLHDFCKVKRIDDMPQSMFKDGVTALRNRIHQAHAKGSAQ